MSTFAPKTIRCTRRFTIDAAHRVRLHESNCKWIHGHRYIIIASFEAPQLDPLGRVIDFSVIKQRLGTWLDTHWDHTLILHQDDRPLGDSIAAHTTQTIYYLPANPTAENLALHLLEIICPELFADAAVRCTGIVVEETANCSAEALSSFDTP